MVLVKKKFATFPVFFLECIVSEHFVWDGVGWSGLEYYIDGFPLCSLSLVCGSQILL